MGNYSSSQPAVYHIDKFFDTQSSPSSKHRHHEHKYELKNITKPPEPFYHGFLTKHKNLIWTGVLSVSYADFKRHFLQNSQLSIQQKNSNNYQIIQTLSQGAITKSSIPQSQTYVQHGTQTLHIYHTHTKRSPSKTFYQAKEVPNQNSIIVYGCLIKKIVLKSEYFEALKIDWNGQADVRDSFGKCYVRAIGFKSEEALGNLKVIEYVDNSNLFVGFKPEALMFDQQQHKNPNTVKQAAKDVIYILVSSPQKPLTIQSVIQKVITAQQSKPIDQRQPSKFLDSFKIPLFSLDETYHYPTIQCTELINAQYKQKNLKLIEQVEVQFNGKNSEGTLPQKEGKCMEKEQTPLKRMNIEVNGPFWIALCRQNKHPYLVANIKYLGKQNSI